jgi:hypothetical protein
MAPFRGLGVVARELKIPLTLIGGTASRAAIRLIQKPRVPLDLFDLAPFSSDIDLEYDADPKRGPEVRAAISEHVPFASWFRWSLIDRERAARAAAQREVSTIVPLRRIRWSTDQPPDISEEALMDLHTGRVRFWRNPRFHSGAGPKRDAEIFGLMMAMNVEADFRSVQRHAPGIDEYAALEWLNGDGWKDLTRILDDEQLRGRFWTLFATRWSLAGPRGRVFEALTWMAEQIGVLRRLNFNPEDVDAPIVVSKVGAFGQFRAPELTPDVITGDQAASKFVAVFNELAHGLGLPGEISTPGEAIDPALELVAVAPLIKIAKLPRDTEKSSDPFESGINDTEKSSDPFESGVNPFESGINDEFIQVSWPHKGPVTKGGFTAQLLPLNQRRSSASFSSVPAVGAVQDGRAWVRIRLDDLTDPDEKGSSTDAALVILQAHHD